MSQNNRTAASATKGRVIDFCGKKHIFFTISAVIILGTLLLSFILGVQMSIEFKGGTVASYSYEGDLSDSELSDLISETLNVSAKVQLGETFTGKTTKSFTASFTQDVPFNVELQEELLKKLTETYPDAKIELLESNDIAPASGKQFFIKCLVAVSFAAVLLVLYIAWRFKRISGWSAGVFAVVALLHDLIAVFGAVVICGYSIDSNFIAVVLTILGYSVNDTIVIYDRIRENQKLFPKMSLFELVNLSLSQTMGRTLRVAFATMISMVIVSIVAAISNIDSILSFSIPMIAGMFIGSYSSLCIAPMLWVTWKTRAKKA